MHFWNATLLGIVQGLTEFLPVSSSAHLAIVEHFLKLQSHSGFMLVFDVFVHLGTLCAVLIYYRKDFFPLSKLGARQIWYLGVATVVTVVVGFSLKHKVENLGGALVPIGIALLVNACFLTSLRLLEHREGKSGLNFLKAFLIGLVQGIAVVPGLSRSGITITAGLWLGLKREEAVKFSFWIAVPAIIGANVLVLHDSVKVIQASMIPGMLTGLVTSFVFGYLAIAAMMKLVQKGKLYYFAYYTFVLAVFLLTYTHFYP